ncbi:uncharacterized protein LOC125369850 [Ricinus communis]|uniref:uncharacterized protein LOC125369850 n=1 Tax=Ricinus communis TaxID=3988 RepID=UPI00201AC500|nr:uncharacterized protein LOC125369850 [Ricinus communis]
MKYDVARICDRCNVYKEAKSKTKSHDYVLTWYMPNTIISDRNVKSLSYFWKTGESWEDCLLHFECAYNRSVHSSTNFYSFEIVYSFIPLSPLDLIPLPLSEQVNLDGKKKAEFMKARKNEQYAKQANNGRVKVVFEPSEWVWVHTHKECFPTNKQSRLLPRGDGLFQVLKCINDNAYKLDLPGEYGLSATFNVTNLSPFDFDGGFDLRENHLE